MHLCSKTYGLGAVQDSTQNAPVLSKNDPLSS